MSPARAPADQRTARASLPLGIFAESAAGPKNNGLGRVFDLDEHRRRAEHRERWANQRAAAGLLQRERVADCQRSLSNFGVDVVKGCEDGRTWFNGVVTCDSRWLCPLCAAKITERDRRELQLALVLCKRAGGEVYLLTFTFPHDVTLPLREGLDRMQRAQRMMKGKRAYKKIMAGTLGSVKALEVTYGENGWHPHVHMLVLVPRAGHAEFESVRELWAAAVRAVGLRSVNEHGFDVRSGDYAAEYIAKFGKEASDQSRLTARAWWTASHELTKGHTKQTQRLKGATPFTLLRWYREGDAQAGALFVEYAEAFKGRAQLYWSPGLRKKIDLLELQQPKKKRERPVKIVHLEREDWHAILRHNARWEVLYVAERYGAEAVAELVAGMRRSRGRWRGDFKTMDPFGKSMGFWRPSDQVDPWGRAAA